jgi:cytochrome bd-type quinol oxidase subunit 2
MEVRTMKIWKPREKEDERERKAPDTPFWGSGYVLARKKRKAGGAVAVAIAAFLIGGLISGTASAATGQEKLNQTITNIQTFLIGIGIALAGIMIVLAGTKWMTTRGQPEEQARVKTWLMDIGIGLILIISSSVMIECAKGLIVK